MKIDRVILSSNNNPTYYEFWNPLSKLYLENFGIKPTLIYIGDDSDIQKLNLSTKYGEIIVQNVVPSKDVSWTTTWALFYFTKKFQNDIILINGIDQIPLGTKFLIDNIKDVEDDKYVMMIDDAYKLTKRVKDWSEEGNSPSAYHIAKGKIFDEIYEFEDTFEEEIKKIESLGLKGMWGTWGLDEVYSSLILSSKKNEKNIVCFSDFKSLLYGGRIECNRIYETPYDIHKLKNNEYIECHSCRPYSKHEEYLNKLFNSIPKYI